MLEGIGLNIERESDFIASNTTAILSEPELVTAIRVISQAQFFQLSSHMSHLVQSSESQPIVPHIKQVVVQTSISWYRLPQPMQPSQSPAQPCFPQ